MGKQVSSRALVLLLLLFIVVSLITVVTLWKTYQPVQEEQKTAVGTVSLVVQGEPVKAPPVTGQVSLNVIT